MENKKYKILNSNWLKIIALIAMTIDHVTWLIFPGYNTNQIAIILHIIGRLAFPIFAYCIAEGYHYTKNLKKYALTLLIFSLISHIPYMLQAEPFRNYGWMALIPFATGNGINRFLNQYSVLFAYFIGLLMLIVNDSKKLKYPVKVILVLLLCLLSFPCDWSCVGSLVVLSIGSNRGKPLKQIINSFIYICMYAVIYILFIDSLYGHLQLLTLLAIPVIALYNGKKGNNLKVNKIMKWVFYLYYPVHLLVIGLVGLFI